MPRLATTASILLLAAGRPALATVYNVPGDAATIQEGVDLATAAGDEVHVAAGTWSGAGNTNVQLRGVDITVRGLPGAIIDGGGTSRAFEISLGETNATVIEGFTIENGFANDGGGAITIDGSDPTIRDCAFDDNTTTFRGGAISMNLSSPVIRDCTFEFNSADMGGALYVLGSGPTIIGCEFTRNHADDDGGAIQVLSSTASTPVLRECEFLSNTADADGGALHCDNNSAPELTDCSFTSNRADADGGAVLADRGSDPDPHAVHVPPQRRGGQRRGGRAS